MNSKKRKLSGLSGMELRLAYERLLELKKTFLFEESEGTSITDRNNVVVDEVEAGGPPGMAPVNLDLLI